MWGYRCFSSAGCFLKTNVSYVTDRKMWQSSSVGFADVIETCYDSGNCSGLIPLQVLGGNAVFTVSRDERFAGVLDGWDGEASLSLFSIISHLYLV